MSFAAPSRPRWCDVRDSSSESLNDSPPAPPLAAKSFDSYCETPDQDLAENSSSVLNQLMAQVGSTTPMKFIDFMDQTKKCEAPIVETRSVDGTTARTHDALTQWQPDPDAPEFVPMNCPVRPISINPATKSAATMAAAHEDFSIFIDSVATMPATGRVPDGTDQGMVQPTPIKPKIWQKRKQSATSPLVQTPMGKRLRAEESSASFDKDTGLNITSSLPEASEEDWLRRIEKRKAAVVVVKSSQEYNVYKESVLQREGSGLPIPRTPDPTDRAVSKRRWEDEVRLWRIALRNQCSNSGQHPST